VKQRGMAGLLVVERGIGGAGVARDAAGHGLSVLFCEQSDRGAEGFHGGLRG
jgi:glycerol-3-phosphate dehydrogenase